MPQKKAYVVKAQKAPKPNRVVEPASACGIPVADSLYKTDFRVTNPSLHVLYMKQAIVDLAHLCMIIRRLDALGSNNMGGAVEALITERDTMIQDDAAMSDAWDIIKSLDLHLPASQRNLQDGG